ncbi:MAG: hypothetical protein QOH26_492, partial [Actinomycetota bacterium]|nr:hypothetical protein [Actinomycetota bacterium]
RARAVEVLGGFDAELSADHLVEAAKDPADDVRQAAEDALLAQRPAAVADVLVARLASPSHRRIAQNLLVRVGADAIPALVAAAPNAPGKLADVIASLLVEVGAEERLLADLDDRDPRVRISALIGLGVISATQHIGAIASRLEDPMTVVRIQAAEVLGALGDDAALEPLKKAFVSDPDMGVVATIEGALRRLTEDQPDAD